MHRNAVWSCAIHCANQPRVLEPSAKKSLPPGSTNLLGRGTLLWAPGRLPHISSGGPRCHDCPLCSSQHLPFGVGGGWVRGYCMCKGAFWERELVKGVVRFHFQPPPPSRTSLLSSQNIPLHINHIPHSQITAGIHFCQLQ